MANKCLVIAEIGINHNGDISLAKETIIAAKECGVDAVKFQTFKAEEFIGDSNLTYTYESQGKTVTESQIEMFKRYEFSRNEWLDIIQFCNKNEVLCFTTPQNKSDLDFILDIFSPPIIKVGSDDLTNLDLLRYYASKKIPMIISTGMSFSDEIEEAIEILREFPNLDFTVLHCVSSYPTEDFEVNMKKMLTIKEKFNVKIGFSDHTRDHLAAIVAVAQGAVVIEKHFTLDNNLPGPDHRFSANPTQMKKLVQGVRRTEILLGSPDLVPVKSEIAMRSLARRSIVVNKALPKGHVLCREDLSFKRPGTGLPPKKVDDFIGETLKVNKSKNDIILYEEIL